jgi:Asp-tRNA(Asn)/Glu-tRNA(Gln) amidotransferase A subunit family amidase
MQIPLAFDDDDPGDAGELWAAALADVEALMPRLIPILLPPGIPDDAVRAYLAGALYTAAMVTAGVDANGLRLNFPTLQAANLTEAAERLISWETMLPWPSDWQVTQQEAEVLATRFSQLALLCKKKAKS